MKNYVKAGGFGALYVAFITIGIMLVLFLVNISVPDDLVEGAYALLVDTVMMLIIPLVSAVIIFIGTVSENMKSYFVKLLGVICGIIAGIGAVLAYCNYIAPPKAESSLGEGLLMAIIIIYSFRLSIIGAIVSGVVSVIRQIKERKVDFDLADVL